MCRKINSCIFRQFRKTGKMKREFPELYRTLTELAFPFFPNVLGVKPMTMQASDSVRYKRMKKLLAEKKVEVAEREKKPPEVGAPTKRQGISADL